MERNTVNKHVVYVAIAVILGLVIILLPTWVFFATTAERGQAVFVRSEGVIPFLDYAEENHVQTVSPKEFGLFGVSLVAASIVYFLFRRK